VTKTGKLILTKNPILRKEIPISIIEPINSTTLWPNKPESSNPIPETPQHSITQSTAPETPLLPISSIIPAEDTPAEQTKHLGVSTIIGDRDRTQHRDSFPTTIENIQQEWQAGKPLQKEERKRTEEGSEPRESTRSTKGQRQTPRYHEEYGHENNAIGEAYITVQEALTSPEAEEWKESIIDERGKMEKFGVFTWIDKVLPGKPTIDTKLVLKRKDNGKRKARLTARGFTQVPGRDYNATFTPVCREETWRAVIAIGLERNWIIVGYDVEAAYLNSPIMEELYVKDPLITGERAWRLRKALYGLKQSAHNWNTVLDDILIGEGFTKSSDDLALYCTPNALIAVHVDDCMVAFSSLEEQRKFENLFTPYVKITGETKPKRYLGMQLNWGTNFVDIHGQEKITRIANSWEVTIPAKSPFRVTSSQHSLPFPDKKLFQKIVGELLFVTRMWRPDIRYAVARICRKTSNPTYDDMEDAKKVMAYLLGSASKGIRLKGIGPLKIFVDAGEEKLEHKATSGVVAMLGSSPISWSSRKQDVTTLSSTEAEYLALTEGTQLALWMQRILEDMGVRGGRTPMLLVDNAGAARLAENPEHHRRTKHIRRRHHFVREAVQAGEIEVTWVKGQENPADMLSKVVSVYRIEELAGKIGVMDAELEGSVGNNPATSSDGTRGSVVLAAGQGREA
jgi:hypothetical protein